jgi:hypothetical protein
MPGLTTYLDTPVVPTIAFAGAGYNNGDCSYPDATPAIAEVDSSDGIGPWVSAAGPGHTLTITALGTVQVNNYAYSGPSANVAPFNQKTVARHYGFGATPGSVTIGGKTALVATGGWSDSQIVVTVPSNVGDCPIQQQVQYTGSSAQCGQLVITAANGKQSIDTVTVTVGGKPPVHVSASQSVQAAIDAADPGDLIIVDPTCMTVATAGSPAASATCNAGALHATAPAQTASVGSHTEMLIMWKPVRLQGVGAASSVINANAIPAGTLLDPWRRHVNCLFGLTLQGVPVGSTSANGAGPAVYDSTNTYNCPDTDPGASGPWNAFVGTVNSPQIDRLPLEATVGWDATLNGNLAEQLQEPSLMGAFEGAGITVLAKGVDFHGANPWGNEAAFPAGTTILTGVGPDPTQLATGDNNSLCIDGTTPFSGANRFPSNFVCNPSSIDGLTITNSSQGGGGIFVHGWAHHLQIANNRVYNNTGTLTGGISVGQGEFPDPIVAGAGATATNLPGSCSDGTGFVAGQHLPYCLQIEVNVHNNFITNNASLGDELFSATLAGGGGATMCTGNDYYMFNYNWVCGNESSGEGGGIVHLGETQHGDIEHNTIAFNQSNNPTIPTNGGGIEVMGTPDPDPVCGTITDTDCPVGLSDGTGHGLVINANLIQGNMAESGSGGGIRLQNTNGSEVSTFPSEPVLWNDVQVTNNIIVNNVAGWDGAGISLQDALNVNIVNNTIAHNDSLATSGALTTSIGAPLASGPNTAHCTPASTTTSCPQSAGVTSTLNSSVLTQTFTGLTITCPPGHYAGGTAANGTCTHMSYPALYNDLIYQNLSMYAGITTGGTGNQNQQNLIGLFMLSGAPAPAQTSTGLCTNTAAGNYWDIGVRGDAGPGNHNSGFTITPQFTATTSTLSNSNSVFISQYCNGSRVPPECSVADGCGGPGGYGTPPGIADALTPNPRFSFSPAATVDEGNNWINVSWGPLTLTNPSIQGADGNFGGGPMLGNYGLAPNSTAIDAIPATESVAAGVTIPKTDFFGNPRPNPDGDSRIDYGAVEVQADRTVVTPTLASINPNSGFRGTAVNVTLTGTHLTGASAINVSGTGVTVSNLAVLSDTTVTATFTISSGTTAATGARNVTVVTPDGTTNAVTFTVLGPSISAISPNPLLRSTTATTVTITGADLLGATAVAYSGGGVTCTGVASSGTVAASTVTASCTSTATAGAGARTVTVTTPNGNATGSDTITVPTLSSINPTTGVRGTSVPVTLTGTNLAGASAITVSPSGVSCSITGTATATTVTATCAITASATLGAHNVAVITATNGTTGNVAFTVQGATLTSINPNSQTHPATGSVPVNVTFTGTNLSGATGLTGLGAGVTLASGTFHVVNATTVTATLNVASTATLGAHNIGVATTIGNTNTVTFTVN